MQASDFGDAALGVFYFTFHGFDASALFITRKKASKNNRLLF